MLVAVRFGAILKSLVAGGIIGAVLLAVLTAPSTPVRGDPISAGGSSGASGDPGVSGRVAHRVVGTGGAGLNVRSCAGTGCSELHVLDDGDVFWAQCWTRGDHGVKWLRGALDGDPAFASGRYLRPEGSEGPAGLPPCPPRG